MSLQPYPSTCVPDHSTRCNSRCSPKQHLSKTTIQTYAVHGINATRLFLAMQTRRANTREDMALGMWHRIAWYMASNKYLKPYQTVLFGRKAVTVVWAKGSPINRYLKPYQTVLFGRKDMAVVWTKGSPIKM